MTETATAPPRTMQELFDAYGDAWASHDADAIAAFHASDGIFHLHADGELAAKYTYLDSQALLRQLGG